MLTVQESSGLYQAVQYDGTNGAAIVAALEGTDYSNIGGVLSFRSFIMRAGGLLTSGHRFNMAIGSWIVWVNDVNPYVVGGPMTQAEFEQQYQVAASATEIAALQAEVTALGVTVGVLGAAVAAMGDSVTALGNAVIALDTSLGLLESSVDDLDALLHASSATWITSGVLPFARLAGTIAENQTITLWNRPTLVTPGTAADSWQWLYNGTRTVYGNEYNLLRVRGVPEDQVVARFMSNFARDGLATGILQATLSNGTSHLFQVLGNGDIQAAGGASMLPTAPLAVTFNGNIGNAALISDGSVNTGAPYALTTTLMAANNRVFIDGAIANNGGVSIPGGTLLFTIGAAHRPASWVQFNARTSTTLSTRVTIRGATGQVFADQAMAAAATLSCDGMNYRKA